MLETGFSLIAVNLPSLYVLVAHVSAESIVRSVRSMISLQSIRSRSQRNSPNNSNRSNRSNRGAEASHPYTRKDSSTSGEMELVDPKAGDFSIIIDRSEAGASADHFREDLEPGIHVQKTVHVGSKERVAMSPPSSSRN
jgi:hypothetical protein